MKDQILIHLSSPKDREEIIAARDAVLPLLQEAYKPVRVTAGAAWQIILAAGLQAVRQKHGLR